MRAIDLFAGLGGFSQGATEAGVEVVYAANHWSAAVEIHSRNHPEAIHACEDVHRVNWREVPAHDVLLASPCCQGHSKARGKENGNPQHDASRATAFAVVDALEACRPQLAVIENVVELAKWSLFPAWRASIEALGYCLAPHIIDAANHGVPQHRERLFLVATRSKHPIMLQFPVRPHVPASSFIDFNAGNWQPIRKPGRAPNTLARIDAGRRVHGDRFISSYYGNEKGGRSINRPVGTITTKDRHAIIDGDRMRMLSRQECRAAMGFPADYILPDTHAAAIHMLGNAVSPPAARDVLLALKEAA